MGIDDEYAPQELDDAGGLSGMLRGYLPQRWPGWFSPTPVDFHGGPFEVFPESHTLTTTGDIRLVPTPGHTRGHMSVVLDRGDDVVFLAGDTSYTEANLLEGVVDGVASVGGGERTAALTLGRIRSLSRRRPLVYLPSHDPDSAVRLASASTCAATA